MAPTSYADVFDIDFDHDAEEDIRPGDMVRTGQNSYPQFTVVAVHGETAWVRNVDTGADGLTAVARCRKINGAPALTL